MCGCEKHWHPGAPCTCPCDHTREAGPSQWDEGSAEHEAPYLHEDADPPFGLSDGALE